MEWDCTKRYLQELVDACAQVSGTWISQNEKTSLVECIVPYAKIRPHSPSVLEIKAMLERQSPATQKSLGDLLNRFPDTLKNEEFRKTFYFLLKASGSSWTHSAAQISARQNTNKPFPANQRSKPQPEPQTQPSEALEPAIPQKGIIRRHPKMDAASEQAAHKAAKNASIGVYLSWFRDIADGRAGSLKDQIDPGVFDICYMIYIAGEAYTYLQRQTIEEVELAVASVQMNSGELALKTVVKEHLRKYREGIYGESSGNLFEFYVLNTPRMKWISRMSHLVQELMGLARESECPEKQIVEYAEKLEHSPWTSSFASRVLQVYKDPLFANVLRWMSGESVSLNFIEKVRGKGFWAEYSIRDSQLPACISQRTSREILYIGKTQRLVSLLNRTVPPEHWVRDLSLRLPDDTSGHLDVSQIYAEAQALLRREYFRKHRVIEHLERLKDIFFLFRDDFSVELGRASTTAKNSRELAALVDEALEKCFGPGVSPFVDVFHEPGVRLAYRPILPYGVLTEPLGSVLSDAFEFFWQLRRTVRDVHLAYAGTSCLKKYGLVSKAREIEYYCYERVVRGLWNIRALPEEHLSDPEKITKFLEDTTSTLLLHCASPMNKENLQSISLAIADHPENTQYVSDTLFKIQSTHAKWE